LFRLRSFCVANDTLFQCRVSAESSAVRALTVSLADLDNHWLNRRDASTTPVITRGLYRKEMPLAEADTRALEAEERLADFNRLPYLKPDFWKRSVKTPFWASLDLEKFYPKVSLECIKENIRQHCASAPELCGTILDDLLHFRLHLKGWSPAELQKIDLDPAEDIYAHIPTGLMAAGFLANVAMLKVDRAVGERIQEAQVAHFRYVDDHIVLAPSFDALEKWVAQYELLIADHRIGTAFNAEKFEPKEFGAYYLAKSDFGGQH
jgi:hypothetical protein